MGDKCPKCGSESISGLMQAFWVELDDEGYMVGQWSDYESCTEVGDERMCRDCGFEFEQE